MEKGQKKQKLWKRDIVRSEDSSKMKDMVSKLKKFRVAENSNNNNTNSNNAHGNN